MQLAGAAREATGTAAGASALLNNISSVPDQLQVLSLQHV